MPILQPTGPATDDPAKAPGLAPGQLIARGVCRYLAEIGHTGLTEFVPTRGLRVDVLSLARDGEIWIIECKSSRNDFVSDHKWQGYLDWCDRYFWAVDAEFPRDMLPADSGLILADAYGAEMLRDAPLDKLAPARRKAVTLKVARTASARLLRATDPDPSDAYMRR